MLQTKTPGVHICHFGTLHHQINEAFASMLEQRVVAVVIQLREAPCLLPIRASGTKTSKVALTPAAAATLHSVAYQDGPYHCLAVEQTR